MCHLTHTHTQKKENETKDGEKYLMWQIKISKLRMGGF